MPLLITKKCITSLAADAIVNVMISLYLSDEAL